MVGCYAARCASRCEHCVEQPALFTYLKLTVVIRKHVQIIAIAYMLGLLAPANQSRPTGANLKLIAE